MAIDDDTLERHAEASALRVLMQTVAVLVFEQSGMSPVRVRALGQSLSAEMSSIEIPGASYADLEMIREANAGAVIAAFSSVAEAMRDDQDIAVSA
ncbi:hypothetical protein FV232_23085 [Methylobacterium sp. WL30]|uniref:hypothetical protein n=1 Tax=unclassified Methylobacterium TaxID=2615210 RepID=UPI0011CC0761|nr:MULTISPECIES: hypothetical protein [unclassified Methylobacterium]TXN40608.1 hypothetical protein FV225_05605 [Methylobacterium sp. WL93]TXN51546.1 hypothetical protein FV227_07120 [Methylobacterium sp. WL119]TXN63550.1 hypothetical protein FV232_23085 [Methylobacterium sp. WL30]